MKKINVTLLSDTHTKERNVLVNGGDLILHSGDVMNSGYDWEDLYDFLTWFSELPYKIKVFTPGTLQLRHRARRSKRILYCI